MVPFSIARACIRRADSWYSRILRSVYAVYCGGFLVLKECSLCVAQGSESCFASFLRNSRFLIKAPCLSAALWTSRDDFLGRTRGAEVGGVGLEACFCLLIYFDRFGGGGDSKVFVSDCFREWRVDGGEGREGFVVVVGF